MQVYLRRASPHFTGKMRDTETNLDYFGARYNSSSLGRFMSPDWTGKPTSVPYAEFGDPQSLNLYAYVRNNPLSRADADGHGFWQKLKNWIEYQHFVNDADLENALAQDAKRYSQFLLNQNLVIGNRPVNQQYLSGLSNRQIVDLGMNTAAELGSHDIVNVPGAPEGAAGQIANGHAWDMHSGEFPNLTRNGFQQLIEDTIKNPSEVKILPRGRIAYWSDANQTVVIYDPASSDGGTAFRPTNGKAYFDQLDK